MAMRILFFFLIVMGVLVGHEFPDSFYKALKEKNLLPTKNVLIIKVKEQKLELYTYGEKRKSYIISTAKNGVGQKEGDGQTPLGFHKIARKIGDNAPAYAIFQGRQRKGIWRGQEKYKKEDLIMTRICWLEGMEEGFNKGKDEKGCNVDSYNRHIYIHATNHEELLGKPVSKGCIRMSTEGIIDLYSLVQEGDILWVDN